MGKLMMAVKKAVLCAAAVAAMLIQFFPQSVMAKGLFGSNEVWLRAKVSYEHDKGVEGLSDKILRFSSDKWKKKDGWYYYKVPVESGQRIRFIDGVQLPAEWDNDYIDKRFAIIVTVEAAEVPPGEEGWEDGTRADFSKSFDLWNTGYDHEEDVYIKEGKTQVSIHEYQLDKDGNEIPYENDKVVTPGQFVSKIVEFEVSGGNGATIQLKPEKPVKTVTANNIDVNGKTVEAGTVLTYGITVKNPSPEDSIITIIDEVDERLKILDTIEGTLVSGSLGGNGGTIEWSIDVPGGESYTVHFIAQTPDEVAEDDGIVIPNTAEATIVGKELRTNTVLVHLGKTSIVDTVIAYIDSRKTGDSSNIPVYAAILIGGIAGTVFYLEKKKRKK